MAIDGITSDFIYSGDQKPQVVDANYDNSKMSQEDFLKVLLADIQWQDPLNAKDISEFINNAVKLQELEVLNSFESNIQTFVSTLQSQSLFFASNFIGKLVEYEGNQTYVQNGTGYASFSLSSPADSVKVTILDHEGNIVEEKVFSNLSAGEEYPIEINNPNLTDGYYTVFVEATNQGVPVDATVKSLAYVNQIRKDKDGIYAVTDVSSIPLDKIIGIGG
ncbi:flagellar hook capping protein [Desulfurobacterium thermolithotrophum DSM 11699]|uniref:Basal-body rod modification protein FlgD n=1 Tax=Desulfurobacterium thermolithotrophum (strain DSM 11699 / BSA) TaxID=868864 RepID=F0S0R8_DESTD|nr:FlgD immunoglobulin-like domain containing protein [Desulfurobacterium thermolithotrophum]ADY73871.1 flagellar hook capping protein [Desulfurobacterium thermolithotrophum DSM 11699]